MSKTLNELNDAYQAAKAEEKRLRAAKETAAAAAELAKDEWTRASVAMGSAWEALERAIK